MKAKSKLTFSVQTSLFLYVRQFCQFGFVSFDTNTNLFGCVCVGGGEVPADGRASNPSGTRRVFPHTIS